MQYRLLLYLHDFNIRTYSQIFMIVGYKVYLLHIYDFFYGNKCII